MASKIRQEFKQSVLFCLQEEHRPKCNERVSLGEPYERQEARRIGKKSLRQSEYHENKRCFFSSSASTSMAQQTGNRQQQSTETSQALTMTGPTKQALQSIQSLLGSNATLKAEICWTLKVITSQ